jgi:hypothetical protein
VLTYSLHRLQTEGGGSSESEVGYIQDFSSDRSLVHAVLSGCRMPTTPQDG